MKNIIIGLTGLNGSGKGLVAECFPKFFVKDTVTYVSVSEQIRKFLGEDVSRESFRIIANKYREENGGEYWIKKILENYQNPVLVIESIRSPDEFNLIKLEGGVIIAVKANDFTRYQRVKRRAEEKDSSFTKTFQDFIFQEKFENDNTETWKQNVPYCIEKSDFFLENNDFFENEKDASCSKRQLIRDALDLIPRIIEKVPDLKSFYNPNF